MSAMARQKRKQIAYTGWARAVLLNPFRLDANLISCGLARARVAMRARANAAPRAFARDHPGSRSHWFNALGRPHARKTCEVWAGTTHRGRHRSRPPDAVCQAPCVAFAIGRPSDWDAYFPTPAHLTGPA